VRSYHLRELLRGYATMNPKKRYVLQDFKQYAHKHFPSEFALVADPNRYEFSFKTFLDANNGAHEVVMLFVGHYHKRSGGPPVWACTTSSSTQYYHGLVTESACALIPEDQSTRVYYDAPYSLMYGSQQGKGMTAGRKAGRTVVETFISFLFLLGGHLKVVNNAERSDMLMNFKFACLKLQQAQCGLSTSKLPVDQRRGISGQSADQRAGKKRKLEVKETASNVKEETDDDEVMFMYTNQKSTDEKCVKYEVDNVDVFFLEPDHLPRVKQRK
jgi:hypothetical protein